MTDAEAIQRVLDDEDEAFRFLVERHSRAIFRLACRMTGRTDDADDIVQEAFLRAYRRLEAFEQRSSFSTWLHQIAVRCTLDLIDSRKRHNEQQDHEENPMTERIADDAATPDRNAMGRDTRERIAAALSLLTGNEHTAFILRHCEGMSIEEIGTVLGTNTNATKNTIFRAVKKLRSELEPLVRISP